MLIVNIVNHIRYESLFFKPNVPVHLKSGQNQKLWKRLLIKRDMLITVNKSCNKQ